MFSFSTIIIEEFDYINSKHEQIFPFHKTKVNLPLQNSLIVKLSSVV